MAESSVPALGFPTSSSSSVVAVVVVVVVVLVAVARIVAVVCSSSTGVAVAVLVLVCTRARARRARRAAVSFGGMSFVGAKIEADAAGGSRAWSFGYTICRKGNWSQHGLHEKSVIERKVVQCCCDEDRRGMGKRNKICQGGFVWGSFEDGCGHASGGQVSALSRSRPDTTHTRLFSHTMTTRHTRILVALLLVLWR